MGWIDSYLREKMLKICPERSVTEPETGQTETTQASSIILLLENNL
jgi:hypothetical protein